MDVVIRAAEPGDLQVIARLIEEIELFYGATDIQPFDERLWQVKAALFDTTPLAHAVVAEDPAGDIVGLAAYSFLWPAAGSTHSLFLKELYVRDSVRRSGVASRLMREIFNIADARPGCSRVEWMTDSDNTAAREFYRTLGFPETAGRVAYRVREDEYLTGR